MLWVLWVAELECAGGCVVPRMPICAVLQGFVCPLSLWPLIQCCPQSPELLKVCEVFHIYLGVVKLLWEGLS